MAREVIVTSEVKCFLCWIKETTMTYPGTAIASMSLSRGWWQTLCATTRGSTTRTSPNSGDIQSENTFKAFSSLEPAVPQVNNRGHCASGDQAERPSQRKSSRGWCPSNNLVQLFIKTRFFHIFSVVINSPGGTCCGGAWRGSEGQDQACAMCIVHSYLIF